MKMSKLEKKFVNSERHARGNLKVVERFFQQIDLEGVVNVLEVGCGVGSLASYLSDQYNMNTTGTDFDPEQIKLAKSHYRKGNSLQFQTASATNLPFTNTEFDMVLCFKVLHHIPDWPRALAEIGRVLKPGGYFLWNDLTFAKPLRVLEYFFSKSFGVYTLDQIIASLNTVNLSIIYQEKPKGIIIRHQSMIFKKI